MKLKVILISLVLLLISSCEIIYAQGNPAYSPSSTTLKTNNGVAIKWKAFTSQTVDTTLWQPFSKIGAAYLTLQVRDDASILVYYQRSFDSTVVCPAILWDSVRCKTVHDTLHTFSLTSAMLAANWGRFFFAFKDSAFAIGTTTPTYSAWLKMTNTP